MDISTEPGHVDHLDDFDYELDGQVPKDDLDFGLDGEEHLQGDDISGSMPTNYQTDTKPDELLEPFELEDGVNDTLSHDQTGSHIGAAEADNGEEEASPEKNSVDVHSHDDSVPAEDYANDWEKGLELEEGHDAFDEIDYDDDEVYDTDLQHGGRSGEESNTASHIDHDQGQSSHLYQDDADLLVAGVDDGHDTQPEPKAATSALTFDEGDINGTTQSDVFYDRDDEQVLGDGDDIDALGGGSVDSAEGVFEQADREAPRDLTMSGFSTQPDVKVIYKNAEYSLFAESPDDDPDSYFLADIEAIDAPLSKFLSKVRQVVSEEITQKDELIMRVDGLGLEFGETTTADFLELTTFRQLLELHDGLVKNDEPTASHTLYVHLVTRTNSLRRFADLIDGANQGKGLTELGSYFDMDSGHDVSPPQNNDEMSEDVSLDDQEYFEGGLTQPQSNESVNTDEQDGSLDAVIEIHVDQLVEVGEGDQPDPSDSATVGQIAREVVQEISQSLLPIGDDAHQDEAFTMPEDGLEVGENVDEDASENNGVQETAGTGEHPGGEEMHGSNFEEELDSTTANLDHTSNDISMGDSAHQTDPPSYIEQTTDETHNASVNIEGTDDFDLDLHGHDQTEAGHTQTDGSGHVSTPALPSDNTSATATLNGDDGQHDEFAADELASVTHQGLESLTEPGRAPDESAINEIDWDNDDEDAAENETNLTPSSISAKRGRQAEEGGEADDENVVKRRRT